MYKCNKKKTQSLGQQVGLYDCSSSVYGAYNSLMRDLLDLDSTNFLNYIRMDPYVFEELF